MLSRVADALYWMGRYVERSESITRLLLVTEEFSTETQGLDESLAQSAWKDLLAVFPSAQVTGPHTPFAPLAVPYLRAFFLDSGNPYSVSFSLRKARENARSVREALTLEVFLAINETYRALEAYARRGLADLPAFRDALTATQKGLLTIVGAVEHTFTRDDSWLYLRLGESLERLTRTTLILRAKLPGLLAPEPRADLPLYYTQWRALLRSLSSLENYRKRHGARLEPGLVIAFLLFDPDSPRSLRYGAGALKACVDRIGRGDVIAPPARLVGRLHAALCYDDEELMRRGDFVTQLDHVAAELGTIHDALASQYFVT